MTDAERTTESEAPPTETAEKKEAGVSSLLALIAERGEEAVKRVYGELSENPRMQDARGKLEKLSRTALQQLGIAPLDELNALRGQVGKLEARVRALESGGEPSAEAGDGTPGEGGSSADGESGSSQA